MFKICTNPIETCLLQESLVNPVAGALVCFEGLVRNHNKGRHIVRLEYECFQKLALKEGEEILKEASEEFEILQAQCVHRMGSLEIGEIAVWVGVIAKHRKEAFQACEYIIDEVKVRLPVWKKEYDTEGHAEWVNCKFRVTYGHVRKL